MSSQVLARKWRPRSFSTLVGQDHVVRALVHALDTQRLHHAYLFTGTRGVGKTTIARIVAKALNCEKGVSSTPCGVCSACAEVDQGRYPDYIEMDAASNRGVAEMTQILDAAVYAPSSGRYKVYVIDEVHMLTTTAFNAMLKTLEEPPGHAIFILATTDPQKVPVTVLSRCLQFSLKNMPQAAIVEHTAQILEKEAISFDRNALQLIARAANGSMRDALSLLDQAIAYGGGKVERDAIAQMLGAIDSHDLYAMLGNVLAGQTVELLAQADAMQANGVPLDNVLSDLATLLHRVALAQVAAPAQDGQFEPEQLLDLAQKVSPVALQALYQIAVYGQRDLPLAPDPLSGFTMTLLRMVAFRPQGSVSAVSNAAKLPVASMPLRAPAAVVRAAVPVVEAKIETKIETVSEAIVETKLPAKPNSGLPFDGNWPKLAAAVPLSGVARQLATTSELLAFNGDTFELRVALKILSDAANVNRLKDALSEHFGRPVRVTVQVGAVQGETAEIQRVANHEKRLEQASASVHADPVVQSMMKEFGATIVAGSIRSIDPSSNQNT